MDVDNTESSTSAYHTSERKKSNLAFAFFCMDKERARDMEIFYAFCRLMDDIADEENNPKQARRDSLTRWKDDISSIYAGKTGLSALAEEMLSCVAQIGAFRKSPLYEHMDFKEVSGEFVGELKENLLKCFRDEESYGFLKDDERWQRLINPL